MCYGFKGSWLDYDNKENYDKNNNLGYLLLLQIIWLYLFLVYNNPVLLTNNAVRSVVVLEWKNSMEKRSHEYKTMSQAEKNYAFTRFYTDFLTFNFSPAELAAMIKGGFGNGAKMKLQDVLYEKEQDKPVYLGMLEEVTVISKKKQKSNIELLLEQASY